MCSGVRSRERPGSLPLPASFSFFDAQSTRKSRKNGSNSVIGVVQSFLPSSAHGILAPSARGGVVGRHVRARRPQVGRRAGQWFVQCV